MEKTIGDLFDEPGQVRGEWRISNFLSLPVEPGKAYYSPKFIFLDSFWCLIIYPGGGSEKEPGEWIGLFLRRLSCDLPVTVDFSLSVRTAYEEETKEFQDHTFTNEEFDCGWITFLKRSELQSRMEAMAPSDPLVITYSLEQSDWEFSEKTLCSRLWSMSVRYNSTLTSQKKTDVVLKLEDGEIPAHVAILESSSPVFARMFNVDMQESRTGEVNIGDTTRSVLKVVLTFIYSGDLKELSCENVCEVYKVAHKYELQELRKSCAKFMKRSLCVDTVRDVIALADLYQETILMQIAKDYFAKNKSDIFKSEKWKAFRRENPETACQVLECVFGGDA